MSATSGNGKRNAVIGSIMIGLGGMIVIVSINTTGVSMLAPGMVLVIIGLSVHSRNRTRSGGNRPRLPEGFSPARPQVSASGPADPWHVQPEAEPSAAPDPTGPPSPSGSDVTPEPAPDVPYPSGHQAWPGPPSATFGQPGSDTGQVEPEPSFANSSAAATSPPVAAGQANQVGNADEDSTVPTAAQQQVAELALAGNTVQAIEVLREATGMELYEASQYVLEIRKNAR